MNIGSWTFLAISFWILGYLSSKFIEPNPGSKLVYVPMWMFILLGAPKHEKIPICVMRARSIFVQLTGVIMALFAFLLKMANVNNPVFEGLLGFGASMFLSGIAALWLYRRQSYTWSNNQTDNENN